MRWFVWVYAVTASPFLGCLLAYGIRSPWRRSPVGRAMFTLYAALTAVLSLAAILQLFHPPHAVALVLALVTLGCVCLAGCIQLVTILRLQRRPSPTPRRQEP